MSSFWQFFDIQLEIFRRVSSPQKPVPISDVEKSIIEFYHREDISGTLPGRKDVSNIDVDWEKTFSDIDIRGSKLTWPVSE